MEAIYPVFGKEGERNILNMVNKVGNQIESGHLLLNNLCNIITEFLDEPQVLTLEHYPYLRLCP